MKIKKGAQFTLIVLLLGLLLSSCSTTARLEDGADGGVSSFLEQHHIPAYEGSYPPTTTPGWMEWAHFGVIEGLKILLILYILGMAHASDQTGLECPCPKDGWRGADLYLIDSLPTFRWFPIVVN